MENRFNKSLARVNSRMVMVENSDKSSKRAHRHRSRQLVVQFLYMWDATGDDDWENLLDDFFEIYVKEARADYAFTDELIAGFFEHHDAIDELIESHTQNWAFNRIGRTDLAILRLAVYELFYRKDIPPIVSINEAIDLSKEFSGPEAKRFINGILDRIKEKVNRPLRDPEVQ